MKNILKNKIINILPTHGFINGQFVKTKRLKGRIYSVDSGMALVEYHNGIKMNLKSIPLDKLKIITKQELIDYCLKKGDTAFVQELLP